MGRGRSARSAEAARRFAERRRREDEAPRLLAKVPGLTSLRLEVRERHAGSGSVFSTYVRHVLVERAPALFHFPCGDTACEGGGHELTDPLLQHLTAGEDRFEESSLCQGTAGNLPCRRELTVVAIATRTP